MSIWEAFGMGRHKGFSREAGLLLDEAVELAGSMGCARADTGHLLLAMLQIDRGPAGRFLAGKNITEPAVRRQLAEGRTSPARQLDRKALAPDLRRAMDYALIGAQNAHLPKAEPEHLLCAMLEDTDCAAGVLLASMGVQLAEAVRECRQLSGQFILPGTPRASAMPRGSRASDKYCRDLTRRAVDGELDPVFCRDAELDRMVEILCRLCGAVMAGRGLAESAEIAGEFVRHAMVSTRNQPHFEDRGVSFELNLGELTDLVK